MLLRSRSRRVSLFASSFEPLRSTNERNVGLISAPPRFAQIHRQQARTKANHSAWKFDSYGRLLDSNCCCQRRDACEYERNRERGRRVERADPQFLALDDADGGKVSCERLAYLRLVLIMFLSAQIYRWTVHRCLVYDRSPLPGSFRLVFTREKDDALTVVHFLHSRSQAEISPPHARGLLSGWTQVCLPTFTDKLIIVTDLTLSLSCSPCASAHDRVRVCLLSSRPISSELIEILRD